MTITATEELAAYKKAISGLMVKRRKLMMEVDSIDRVLQLQVATRPIQPPRGHLIVETHPVLVALRGAPEGLARRSGIAIDKVGRIGTGARGPGNVVYQVRA